MSVNNDRRLNDLTKKRIEIGLSLALTDFMKTAIMVFAFLFCFTNSFAQPSEFSVISLIKSKKIPGKIYGSKKLILVLKNKEKTDDYLIDSTFNFKFLNSNKISFFIRFSDVASDIKYGYAEITLQPYFSKMIFLNDHIDSISAFLSGNRFTQTVYAKSNIRYGSITMTEYKIESYLNNKQAKLFTYTRMDKIKEFEKH